MGNYADSARTPRTLTEREQRALLKVTGELVVGDRLRDARGRPVEIVEITRRQGVFRVYNFEVAGLHTYFVTRLGVWSHNCRGGRRPVEMGRAARGAPKATVPYKRPSGATTPAQRASVQGKPCVDCDAVTPKQVADHKTPLVKEHYETGTIDTTQMRSVDAVQPQCPTCSARQGAEMSRYSREQRKLLEGE